MAAEQLARVRDDPEGRVALMSQTYRGPRGRGRRHLPFRRAAVSFMGWQVARGVLRSPDGDPPGSRWWRAVNDRLLLDGCEAMARSAGLGGKPSSPTIGLWMSFVGAPTGRNWYRAHNASVVSAYLENRELAELESMPERFFLNVALLRVLYAHALNGAPRLALGRLAVLARLLGDPRLGGVGLFLSLRRVFPDRYPLRGELDPYLNAESAFGRMLDYGVIAPRLQALYDWSADELGIPALRDLIRDGSPAYAWRQADLDAWRQSPDSVAVRLLTAASSPRWP
jgi:hypothetical protein